VTAHHMHFIAVTCSFQLQSLGVLEDDASFCRCIEIYDKINIVDESNQNLDHHHTDRLSREND